MMFLLYIVIGNALVIASNAWLIYRLYASCFPNNVNSTYYMHRMIIDDYLEVGTSWEDIRVDRNGVFMTFVRIAIILLWPVTLFISIKSHMNPTELFNFPVPDRTKLPTKPWYARLRRKYYPEWYI